MKPPAVAGKNSGSSLLMLMAILVVNGFGYGMIIPLIPIFARELEASSVLVGFIVAAFAVAQTGVSAPGGFLSDRAGRKRVIMLGLFLIGISSILFTLVKNPYFFILFRALEGAGGGLIFPSVSAYVYDISTTVSRGRSMGMFLTSHSVGFTAGPFVGGWLADLTGDMKTPFYACAVMAFTAMVLAHIFLKPHDVRKPSSRKWDDMKAIFAAPGMKPIFFRGFALMFNNGIMLMAFAIYLREELDLSKTLVGAVFLIQGAMMLSLTPLGGALTDRIGRKRPIAFGGLFLVTGTLLITTIPYCAAHFSFSGPLVDLAPVEFWFAALFVIVRGTGIGFNNPAAMSLITETCPEGRKGSAMGTYGSVAGIGLIFGPLTAGFLYSVDHAFPFYAGAVMTSLSVIVLIMMVQETFKGHGHGGDARDGEADFTPARLEEKPEMQNPDEEQKPEKNALSLADLPDTIIVALDDTDSREGMCTTYLAAMAIEGLTRGAARRDEVPQMTRDGQRSGAPFTHSLASYPRLVRLNPNIPWKTRGNGAVAFELSFRPDPGANDSCSTEVPIGEMNGREIRMKSRNARAGNADAHNVMADNIDAHNAGADKTGGQGSRISGMMNGIGSPGTNESVDWIVQEMETLFGEYAELDGDGTNPAFAVFLEPPPIELYLNALHDVVDLEKAREWAGKYAAAYRIYNNGRGLIGACAAAAFSGMKPDDASSPELADRTYEIITYREREKWGTPREVSFASVERMDGGFPRTFENIDSRNRHLSIVPRSPCPILTGIRADSPDDLKVAADVVETGESASGWIIFETNQATDAHIETSSIGKIVPFRSVRTSGVVSSVPRDIKGGHVIFELSVASATEDRIAESSTVDSTAESSTGEKPGVDRDRKSAVIDCAAYEPTKEFRNIVRALRPGDEIEVFGGVRESPLTVNIEKIKITKLAKLQEKIANPVCRVCGKHMKSTGRGKGYRCRICATDEPESAAVIRSVRRRLEPGWYETPSCARRHMSKPLERMEKMGIVER